MAKEKPATKNCKHCQTEIPYAAKVCPQCGRKQKSGALKWILIIAVLFILLVWACGRDNGSSTGTQKVGTVGSVSESSSGSTGDSNSTPSGSTDDTAGTDSSEDLSQTVFHVGDILRDGDTEIIYMASGDYVSDSEWSQPSEGNQYIFLQMAFRNVSENSDTSVSFFSFECYADGYNTDMHYGGDEDLSATLSPGRATSGFLYFEVPIDAQEIVVEYEPNFLTSDKISFAFDGNQDSGYVLEGDATPTEGALHVGESTESKSLKITYLACYRDESDNMFIQPKDGCHFVTCELEFENLSSSDMTVSSISFDAYADGIALDQTFYRDDDLSATMSAGRKARGTVTFEVPDTASVVEVEYDTSFWTSNRVVFSVEE